MLAAAVARRSVFAPTAAGSSQPQDEPTRARDSITRPAGPARTELRASGIRLRRQAATGADSLTPSSPDFRNFRRWDVPIRCRHDIAALPVRPRMISMKPSRFGTVKALLDTYDYCARAGIGTYGGGQFEVGPGRPQIQLLASIFHE
jgi:hypothetical protein